MRTQKNKITEIKNWDSLTIWIICFAGFMLIFSFLAPALFVQESISEKLNFSKSGEIGDTIGGIMNPFVALVGVLLTFLAFYMQIKANQIQKKLFLDGLIAEKQKADDFERKDAEYKLNLLKIDLDNILKDINLKAHSIKTFYESEKKAPFDNNLLFRTPSNKYTRILDLDRLSIYKGFKFFLSNEKNWLKNFNNLYSNLDFLPSFFDELYNIYDNHSKTKYARKSDVTKMIMEFIDEGSKLLTTYKVKHKSFGYLNLPASRIVNSSINEYHKIISLNYDKNGNQISETDFDLISKQMLLPFIKEALIQREDSENFERQLEVLLQIASTIRKNIFQIKQESIWFSDNVKNQYSLLMVDEDDKKCTYSSVSEINDFISYKLNAL